MILPQDKLTEHYSELLQDYYDCADRIVVNAYTSLLQCGAGIRYWWRLLKGDDKDLDTNQLMKFAGRFTSRLKAWTKKNGVPLVFVNSGARKHDMAKELIPKDKNFEGIFAVFGSLAPSKLWEVKRFSKGIDIRRREKSSLVRHYYFYIIDKHWGLMSIRICAHPPFGGQIMLNGHEWVASRPSVKKSGVEKEDNLFTNYPEGKALTRHADTLSKKGRLEKVCEYWFSKCLWFALNSKEQQLSPVYFNYSIYQVEYSRNLLFKRGRFLDEVFEGIIEGTRSKLDIPRLKKIFGQARRPFKHKKTKSSQITSPEVRIEKPDYNLTVFKIHFGKLTVKLYDKGERTLRAEVVVHNAKALKCKRSISNFHEILQKLKNIMGSFLDNILHLHVALVGELDLSVLASPTITGEKRLAGINISNSRIQSVLEAATALSIKPGGFSSKDVALRMQKTGWPDYLPRQAAYDIRKLRGKDILAKIGARKYGFTEFGGRIAIALLSLVKNEVPRILASLKTDIEQYDKEISDCEKQHLIVQKEVDKLKNMYGVFQNAA